MQKLVKKLIGIANEASYVYEDSEVDAHLMMLDDDIVGEDTETKGFDPLAKDVGIRLIQIEANDKCVNFDIKLLNKKSRKKIADYLSDPARIVIMQNAKFDM